MAMPPGPFVVLSPAGRDHIPRMDRMRRFPDCLDSQLFRRQRSWRSTLGRLPPLQDCLQQSASFAPGRSGHNGTARAQAWYCLQFRGTVDSPRNS